MSKQLKQKKNDPKITTNMTTIPTLFLTATTSSPTALEIINRNLSRDNENRIAIYLKK